MIYWFLQWKQEARLCTTLTLSSFHSHWLLQELTPYTRGDPGAHRAALCTGNLEAENTWEPCCSLRSAGLVPRGAGTQGMTGSTSTGKYSDSLSDEFEVVLRATSLKTRSKSASCTVHFTDCSLFSSLLSAYVLVVSTIILLFLSSLGTLPFTWFLPFLFNTFSFCFFCFPVDCQLFFLLFLTAFSPWQLGIEPKPAEVNPLPSKSLGSRSYSRLLLCFFYNLFSYAAFSVVFSF